MQMGVLHILNSHLHNRPCEFLAPLPGGGGGGAQKIKELDVHFFWLYAISFLSQLRSQTLVNRHYLRNPGTDRNLNTMNINKFLL